MVRSVGFRLCSNNHQQLIVFIVNLDIAVHKFIVSLTTISFRLRHIHLVIESLLAQDFPAHSYEVRLHLSENPYLLDQGCPTLTDELEELLKNYQGRFSVVYVENTGPYRKILPVLNEVYSYTPANFSNTLIVTADDDTAYPPFFLSRLYECYLNHHCVIGFRGRVMRLDNNKLISYKQWSITIEKNPTLLNVPTGKDGVLYSPLDLNPDILNLSAAQQHAPKADDLWLKVHSLLAAKPSYIINSELDQEFPSVTGSEPEVSLYRSFNARGGNDEALDNLEHYLLQKYVATIHDLVEPKPQSQQQRAIAQMRGLINVE